MSTFTYKLLMDVYIAKYAYFDTIKEIKFKKIFSVDLELRNLATCIYRSY